MLAGLLGVGQVDAAARRLPGSCRTSTAATFAGRVRRRRPRHARARAGRPRRGRRHAVPGPRDAGRDGHRARRARVPAREPRARRRRRSRAGWRRRRSRSASTHLLDRPTPRALAAASCSASRSAPRSPGARGSCCSTSRPRSSTPSPATSSLAAAPPQRGVGDGGRARRAPPGALPGRRRPRRRAGATARVACDAPPREFLAWAADAAPALQTPGARLFARAGLRPPPRRRQGRARDAARARPAARRRAPPRRRGAAGAGGRPAVARRRRRAAQAAGARASAASGTSCRAAAAILRGVDLERRARASASR